MKNILFKILNCFIITVGVLILTTVFLLFVAAIIIIFANIPPIKFNDWLIAGIIIIIWTLTIFGLSKIPTMISSAYNKLKIKPMKMTKFKIYSKDCNKIFDVASMNYSNNSGTFNYNVFGLNSGSFGVQSFNITDDNIKLLESTGLFYLNKKEAYQGDLFKDKYDNLYRIYKVRGGFAMSVLPFKSTLTGSAPWPLDSLSDEQNASWFENNCSYAGNIYENPELVDDLINE